MSCPCGSTQELAECCEPYVKGEKVAPTAEALMRSRYTSYTMEEVDYIVDTHHPEGREDVDRDAALQWSQQAHWLGLQIVDTEKGGESEDEGVVEFIANFGLQGKPQSHHERSNFRKVDGKWFYVDGEMTKRKPIVREEKKVGRNEPCPCGSGKKYKKCCA
ncbi:MAG: YchJ family protein [Myxococcales bacterium]|nr:YchJ family protein [Myxococcales bacterium]